VSCNVVGVSVMCHWHWGVDVSYPLLGDWTRLQWALHSLHTQRASPFSVVRGGDAALPKLLWDFLFIILYIRVGLQSNR